MVMDWDGGDNDHTPSLLKRRRVRDMATSPPSFLEGGMGMTLITLTSLLRRRKTKVMYWDGRDNYNTASLLKKRRARGHGHLPRQELLPSKDKTTLPTLLEVVK